MSLKLEGTLAKQAIANEMNLWYGIGKEDAYSDWPDKDNVVEEVALSLLILSEIISFTWKGYLVAYYDDNESYIVTAPYHPKNSSDEYGPHNSFWILYELVRTNGTDAIKLWIDKCNPPKFSEN